MTGTNAFKDSSLDYLILREFTADSCSPLEEGASKGDTIVTCCIKLLPNRKWKLVPEQALWVVSLILPYSQCGELHLTRKISLSISTL